MTTGEKNKMLLELYSLYNKSPFGEIQIDTIRDDNFFAKRTETEVRKIFLSLYDEGLIKFEHKLITGSQREIIEVRIAGGIRFTEKGFGYLKELRRSKLDKFWEFLYKILAPIAIIVDILVQIFIWLQKK